MVLLVLLVVCSGGVSAYPSLFANEHSQECVQHPDKALGGHGKPVPDRLVFV
jgi:hypothetical protein